MAKGQFYNPHQRAIIDRYYENLDTIVVQKLSEAVSDLYVSENPNTANKIWASAAAALAKTPADPARVATIIKSRDVVALANLVGELTARPGGAIAPKKGPTAPAGIPNVPVAAPATTSQPAMGPSTSTAASPAVPPMPSGGPPSPETLKSALKAFRKRLKLTKLDEESQIGSSRNPLTGGAHSAVIAIIPPTQFPKEVWEELARQGKLKSSGRGFYALVGV